jgi:hypothetical protein
MSAAVVIALRGIPIHTVAPEDGQFLTYNATANRLEYGSGTNIGRWEPLTNGDPLAPELLFDANGDVIMGFVED